MPNFPSQRDYPVRGLDVSRHQGIIDWRKVSACGYRFVYLKATEGGDFQDASFKDNLRAARDAGFYCGAYHFFSLKTPGAVQAHNFINTVPRVKISLPPAVDLEFWGNSSSRPPVEALQANLRMYMESVKSAYGRYPIAYCSRDFADAYLKNFSIDQAWVRNIVFSPARDEKNPWVFWQFSERGRIPGIDGFVDLDVFHGPPERFEALARNFATP